MREDPRCPDCDGKVSATAQWCIHCGTDFESPTERATEGAGTVTVERPAAVRGSAVSKVSDNTSPDESPGSRVRKVPVTTSTASTDSGSDSVGTRGDSARADNAGYGPPDAGTEWDRMDDRSRDPALLTGERGDPAPGGRRHRRLAAALVARVESSRASRNAVALLVPVVVWALAVGQGSDASGVAAVGAVGLGALLATRSTARGLLAASAAGAGVVLGGVTLRSAASDSTAAVVDSLAGTPVFAALAVALVVAGVWLHRVDL